MNQAGYTSIRWRGQRCYWFLANCESFKNSITDLPTSGRKDTPWDCWASILWTCKSCFIWKLFWNFSVLFVLRNSFPRFFSLANFHSQYWRKQFPILPLRLCVQLLYYKPDLSEFLLSLSLYLSVWLSVLSLSLCLSAHPHSISLSLCPSACLAVSVYPPEAESVNNC